MKFTISRLDKISDISISIGQIIFASVFLEPLLKETINKERIVFGLILATLCWLLSLIVIREN